MKYWICFTLQALSLIALFSAATPAPADEPTTPHIVQAQLKTVLSDLLTKAFPGQVPSVTVEGNTLTLAVNTRSYMVYATDMTGEIAMTLHEEIGPKADGVYLQFQIREIQNVEQADLPGTYRRPYWVSHVGITPLSDGKYECFYSFSYGSRISTELQQQISEAVVHICPPSIPANLIRRRNELLATADSQLRKGLRNLANTYPQLKDSNLSTLDAVAAGQSPVGKISIELAHEEGVKGGSNEKVAEKDRYVVRIYLETYTYAHDSTPRQMALTTVYPFINLRGQVVTDAGDPALTAALAELVRTALSPLDQLNQENSEPCCSEESMPKKGVTLQYIE